MCLHKPDITLVLGAIACHRKRFLSLPFFTNVPKYNRVIFQHCTYSLLPLTISKMNNVCVLFKAIVGWGNFIDQCTVKVIYTYEIRHSIQSINLFVCFAEKATKYLRNVLSYSPRMLISIRFQLF
jgi:hypothetical protein